MERIDRLLAVLADPTRRQVLEILARDKTVRATDLATMVGASPPAMSRHLKVLLDAGVVTADRAVDDARWRVYRLQPQSLEGVQAWLDQLQAGWRDQLASFKRHVESKETR